MKIIKYLWLARVILLMSVATNCGPKKDALKKRPEDVARDFISSVQSGDFEKARTYWSPGSVADIQGYFKMPFKDFCRTEFDCREFHIGPAVEQKGNYWRVVYTSNCNRNAMRFEFYIKSINGIYHLTYNLWKIPDTQGQ